MTLRLIPARGKSPCIYVRGTHLGVSVDKSTKTDNKADAKLILERIKGDIEHAKRWGGQIVVREPKKSNQSFIYAIRSGAFYKIGVSQDPERRLASIQSLNPHGCEIAIVCMVWERLGVNIERQIHAELKEHAVTREWFSAPFNVVKETIERIVYATGPVELMRGPMEVRSAPGTQVHGAFAVASDGGRQAHG